MVPNLLWVKGSELQLERPAPEVPPSTRPPVTQDEAVAPADIATVPEEAKVAEVDKAALAEEALVTLSTNEAMEQGKAVVGGGATSSIGSCEAIDVIHELSAKMHGDTRVTDLDLKDKLVFCFGNSSTERCLSSACVGVPTKAVCVNLDSRRICTLERSEAGHQLFPMTSDITKNGTELKKVVKSLRELLQAGHSE